MSSPQTGKFGQKRGRREKPLPDDGKPRTILAARLRELRKACGDPSYDELEKLSGTYKTGLVDAARVTRLPKLHVIEGYVKGCWAYYESGFGSSFAGADDLSPWHQLYCDAGGTIPCEYLPEETGKRSGEPELQVTPAASDDHTPEEIARAQGAAGRLPRLTRGRGARFLGGRGASICVVAGLAALIVGGAILVYPYLGTHAASRARGATAAGGPVNPGGSISVSAPAPACGHDGQDGFRSPATTPFTGVKTLRTVNLEDISASVEQGVYQRDTYVWLESNPTGNRAGIQLRWSNAPGKWYYCTATVEPGNVSILPDEFATIAIPATVSGHHVIYQACIWHQHPYTSQCSSLF